MQRMDFDGFPSVDLDPLVSQSGHLQVVVQAQRVQLKEVLHGGHGVSNHRKLDYFFNSVFMLTTKGISKLHITGYL